MQFQIRFNSARRWSLHTAQAFSILILSIFLLALGSTASAQEIGGLRQLGQNIGQQFISKTTVARPGGALVAPVESQNFVVYANDPHLAKKVSTEAERFRRELSIKWLGKEIPSWQGKCPIHVKLERNAGGETSFAFVRGRDGISRPIDWKMKIFGPPDRLLDAVLPHEVTHTIFATHFGCPLPRWADEGACTTVEHESERKKNHNMLMEFLTSQPSRGIPFNRMFTMRRYPHDILPLYAQGHSLARFLIMKKGHRKFVEYVGRGLENERRIQPLKAWDNATNEFYNYKDLSDLQVDWLAWVKAGSRDGRGDSQVQLGRLANLNTNAKPVSTGNSKNPLPSRPEGAVVSVYQIEPSPLAVNSLTKAPTPQFSALGSTINSKSNSVVPATYASSDVGSEGRVTSGSWYIREMKKGDTRVASDTLSGKGLSNNRTRKVPTTPGSQSAPPVERDSRLPQEYRSVPATLWR